MGANLSGKKTGLAGQHIRQEKQSPERFRHDIMYCFEMEPQDIDRKGWPGRTNRGNI
jgi:hypothetical protein